MPSPRAALPGARLCFRARRFLCTCGVGAGRSTKNTNSPSTPSLTPFRNRRGATQGNTSSRVTCKEMGGKAVGRRVWRNTIRQSNRSKGSIVGPRSGRSCGCTLPSRTSSRGSSPRNDLNVLGSWLTTAGFQPAVVETLACRARMRRSGVFFRNAMVFEQQFAKSSRLTPASRRLVQSATARATTCERTKRNVKRTSSLTCRARGEFARARPRWPKTEKWPEKHSQLHSRGAQVRAPPDLR